MPVFNIDHGTHQILVKCTPEKELSVASALVGLLERLQAVENQAEMVLIDYRKQITKGD